MAQRRQGSLALTAALAALLAACLVGGAVADLVKDFYKNSCPDAEGIVERAVRGWIKKDPKIAARLLRLHFHDCFVRGCEASVLLDSVDGIPAEKDADINFSLAAFEVVDDIKAKLEAACPGVVSCADLLALAARDAVAITGGPKTPLRLGRRDGFVSDAAETNTLPAFSAVNTLIAVFQAVGLNMIDMIALSGGHTLGQGHCTSVQGRIPPFDDRLLNRDYRKKLSGTCGTGRKFNPDIPLDMDTPSPTTFDNSYFKELQRGRGLFITDSLLNADRKTKGFVATWASDQSAFFRQFNRSMFKMGEIHVLTGGEGEVRFNCRVTNQY